MEIYTAPILVQASLAQKESSLLTCYCYNQVHIESHDSIVLSKTPCLSSVLYMAGWVKLTQSCSGCYLRPYPRCIHSS